MNALKRLLDFESLILFEQFLFMKTFREKLNIVLKSNEPVQSCYAEMNERNVRVDVNDCNNKREYHVRTSVIIVDNESRP